MLKETGLPVSGIGGIGSWRDAAEFLLLGSGTVQVCTAVMHYGFRIVEGMADRLAEWMSVKGFANIEDFRGRSLPRVTDWKNLNLNYKIVAHIDEQTCIGCGLCYTACWDGAYQCIHMDRESEERNAPFDAEGFRGAISDNADLARSKHKHPTPLAKIPRVDEIACVGCNLCSLVCPVEDCIRMVKISTDCSLRAGLSGRKPQSRRRICLMALLIQHGTVVTADATFSADVLVEGSTIREVRTGISAEGHTLVDAHGLLLLPGGIDAHTHLDMPFGGTTSADDFESGTRAAAIGGTTTIVDFAIQAKGTKMRSALDTW